MKTIQPTTNALRMLASVRGEVWAMDGKRIESFALACLDAAEKSEIAAEGFDIEDFFDMRQAAAIDQDGIAHISVKGALLNKAPKIYEKLGLATKYQTIIDETQAAVDAGAVGIVYHVDSPGDTVAGVVEAGNAIASVEIPTVASCEGLSCSAAYWLTSQTDFIVSAPSAEIGNIGAILSWADCTAFWQDMGIEFKALTSEGADLKSTFHLEPDATQLEFLQSRINQAGADFQAAVKAGRSKAGAELDDEIWRAGWYSGQRAEMLGLADMIGTAEEARNLILANV